MLTANAQNGMQNPFERYRETRILDLCTSTEMMVVYCLCKHLRDDSGSEACQIKHKITLYLCPIRFFTSEVFDLQDPMFSSPFSTL